MPWYAGEPLLAHLEGAPEAAGAADGPARLPVQYVIRHDEERHYAGRLASGTLRAGDEVVVLPSGARSRVARVIGPRGDVGRAPRRPPRSPSCSRTTSTSAAAT